MKDILGIFIDALLSYATKKLEKVNDLYLNERKLVEKVADIALALIEKSQWAAGYQNTEHLFVVSEGEKVCWESFIARQNGPEQPEGDEPNDDAGN